MPTTSTKENTNSELGEILADFIALDKKKAEYKEFLEDYKNATKAVVEYYGIGYAFQDEDGTVYKTTTQDGRYVYFEPVTICRTRREGEKKGSLSLKEAADLGFTLETRSVSAD